MPAMLHAQYALQQLFIVGFAVDRVNGRRIDDQKRSSIEVIEKSRVGVAEALEVLGLDELFVRNAAVGHSLQQDLSRSLQIHNQIRRRRIELQRICDLVVEPELVWVQVQLGEQSILLQQEVGDPDRREHVALANLLDLSRALKQEKQLCRQRRLLAIAVEPLEKRVLFGLLEYQLAGEALRQ